MAFGYVWRWALGSCFRQLHIYFALLIARMDVTYAVQMNVFSPFLCPFTPTTDVMKIIIVPNTHPITSN